MNETNFNVYGMIMVWKQLQRVGLAVARCTVALLMKQLNIQGVSRGKRIRTTISDSKTICQSHLANCHLPLYAKASYRYPILLTYPPVRVGYMWRL